MFALEHLADPWPPRLEARLPEHLDEACQARHGVPTSQHAFDVRLDRAAPAQAAIDLGLRPVKRRRTDPGQFLLEGTERRRGQRHQEIGDVGARRQECEQRP
jgi:hypothetical protein